MRAAAVCLLLLATESLASDALEAEVEEVLLHYRLYVDAGYAHSSTRPANRIWRTKTTTFKIDRPVLNLAMAQLWKQATAESRWGFEFGLQAGVDTELALPDTDTSGKQPIRNAEVWQHFYRASATYLFPVGDGLEVTGGLIPGFPGYESFLAQENPTYTRGYITDYVPYFLLGIRATYPATESLDLSLFVVTGLFVPIS